MRISDWSSDVCSSDLELDAGAVVDGADRRVGTRKMRCVLPHQGLVHDETTGAQDHAFERADELVAAFAADHRSEEHTSELQSLMRISYAVFCLNKKRQTTRIKKHYIIQKPHRRTTYSKNKIHLSYHR